MGAGLNGIIVLVTPSPAFKVTVYLQVKYLKKTVRFRDKVTKEH